MNLEDVIEAHLIGDKVPVPSELKSEFEQAMIGHEALQFALGETITVNDTGPADRPPPVLPGDYTIVRELGRGGMGVVYLVQQKSLGRLVAVKVLRPGEATFGPLVKRFLEEARHLARLRHPNIVSIHEIGHAGDEPYFSMDYVEGQPLSAILAKERLSPTRALAIWKQAAEGVLHAHSQGIIHRDLKPANVLLDAAERAYVTDFGLARDMTHDSNLTRSGEVMGTPAYMAPEQALGQSDRIGEVTDVHALGVLLYEMLTGTVPYGNDAPANVLVRLLKEEPLPPRRIDRRIPRELETICLKAMAKEPERRYATVRAFLEDIRRFEAGEPVQARRPSVLYRAARVARHHWRLAAAVVVTAVAVLAIAPFFFGPSAEELIAAGDEQHTAGDHKEAAQFYRTALGRSGPFERVAILERLVRCCQEQGDTQRGIEAGLKFLESDTDAWLGEFDYPVAHELVSHVKAAQGNLLGWLASGIATPELAERRLEIFLGGPRGTDDERSQAMQDLIKMRRLLGKQPFESITDIFGPPPEGKIPKGTPAELLHLAEDTSVSMDNRMGLFYFAAAALEKSGDRPAALTAYRRVYEWQRLKHPVYTGLGNGIGMDRPRTLHADDKEARLLRHLSRTIRRLDPAAPDPLRGGMRFQIAGLDLPPDMAKTLSISLVDLALPDPNRGKQIAEDGVINFGPIGGVAVQLDQTAWVGVADGKYRLYVNFGAGGGVSSESRGARAGQIGKLMSVDFGVFPQDIEIHSQIVDLPIRATLMEDIPLQQPAAGASVDLRRAVLNWGSVPNAEEYIVSFGWIETIPGGTRGNHVGDLRSKSPALRLDRLPPDEIGKLRSLLAGQTADWRVQTYDADGKRIGVSDARQFQVARSVGD